MASLQKKGESWYCQFYWQGRRHTFTLGKVSTGQAEGKAEDVDELLELLERGRVALPPGCDTVQFVKHDGQPSNTVDIAEASTLQPSGTTLSALRDSYLATQEAALETNTRYMIRLHFKHLAATLGDDFDLMRLRLADLQRHVDRRVNKVATATAEKDIRALRAAWNWAVRMGILTGQFPNHGLVYPKTDEKLPFQTRSQIEQQLSTLPKGDHAGLWDCLYLALAEVKELLARVRNHAAYPWIHPMVATAAHTGARRSELLRMLVTDVDFPGGVVTIRKKQRKKGQRTTRRVPLSSTLATVLKAWLRKHPGGPFLFCPPVQVPNSKERSATTGYRNGKDRPKTLAGRLATVRRREQRGILPLTIGEAHDHLKRTLADSKWEVIRGWHVLRHSFISACASKGVNGRMLQEWCGHMTLEMQRRYAHLYPSVQRDALRGVFG
jgi:integrase